MVFNRSTDYILTTDGFRKIQFPSRSLSDIAQTIIEGRKSADKKKSGEVVKKTDTMNKYNYKKENSSSRRTKSASASLLTPDRPSTGTFQRRSRVASAGHVYTVNHSSCTPPHLYSNEKVRIYAREQHKRISMSAQGERTKEKHEKSPRRRVQSADVAYRFGKPIKLPGNFADSASLMHEELTMGQKQYIWGIARCYSVENLKKLNERRMTSTVEQQMNTRMKTRALTPTDKQKLLNEYKRSKQFIQSISEKNKSTSNNRPIKSPKSSHVSSSVGKNSDGTRRGSYDSTGYEGSREESFDMRGIDDVRRESYDS